MRSLLRIPPNLRGLTARCFSFSAIPRKTASYIRIHREVHNNPTLFSSLPTSRILFSSPFDTTLNQLSRNPFSTTSRVNAVSFRDLKSDSKSEDSPNRTTNSNTGRRPPEEEGPAERAYREAQKESEANRSSSKQEKKKEEKDEGKEKDPKKDGNEQKSNEEPPPPPPHGNKSPWQVFTETLRSEFQASKEWNESTKQLAASKNQFTENESVKRARAAYTKASGAATSSTASAIKGTGKVIGQGAAWTWDTSVVKGVRTGVNATASGIDKVTKPVRDTKAFKSVKDVIDDGSSSRYGGWVEKEERRKKRELRELHEAGPTGRRVGKMEEDPK